MGFPFSGGVKELANTNGPVIPDNHVTEAYQAGLAERRQALLSNFTEEIKAYKADPSLKEKSVELKALFHKARELFKNDPDTNTLDQLDGLYEQISQIVKPVETTNESKKIPVRTMAGDAEKARAESTVDKSVTTTPVPPAEDPINTAATTESLSVDSAEDIDFSNPEQLAAYETELAKQVVDIYKNKALFKTGDSLSEASKKGLQALATMRLRLYAWDQPLHKLKKHYENKEPKDVLSDAELIKASITLNNSYNQIQDLIEVVNESVKKKETEIAEAKERQDKLKDEFAARQAKDSDLGDGWSDLLDTVKAVDGLKPLQEKLTEIQAGLAANTDLSDLDRNNIAQMVAMFEKQVKAHEVSKAAVMLENIERVIAEATPTLVVETVVEEPLSAGGIDSTPTVDLNEKPKLEPLILTEAEKIDNPVKADSKAFETVALGGAARELRPLDVMTQEKSEARKAWLKKWFNRLRPDARSAILGAMIAMIAPQEAAQYYHPDGNNDQPTIASTDSDGEATFDISQGGGWTTEKPDPVSSETVPGTVSETTATIDSLNEVPPIVNSNSETLIDSSVITAVEANESLPTNDESINYDSTPNTLVAPKSESEESLDIDKTVPTLDEVKEEIDPKLAAYDPDSSPEPATIEAESVTSSTVEDLESRIKPEPEKIKIIKEIKFGDPDTYLEPLGKEVLNRKSNFDLPEVIVEKNKIKAWNDFISDSVMLESSGLKMDGAGNYFAGPVDFSGLDEVRNNLDAQASQMLASSHTEVAVEGDNFTKLVSRSFADKLASLDAGEREKIINAAVADYVAANPDRDLNRLAIGDIVYVGEVESLIEASLDKLAGPVSISETAVVAEPDNLEKPVPKTPITDGPVEAVTDSPALESVAIVDDMPEDSEVSSSSGETAENGQATLTVENYPGGMLAYSRDYNQRLDSYGIQIKTQSWLDNMFTAGPDSRSLLDMSVGTLTKIMQSSALDKERTLKTYKIDPQVAEKVYQDLIIPGRKVGSIAGTLDNSTTIKEVINADVLRTAAAET